MALTFRTASSADLPALRDVFGHEPSDEQVGLAGGDRSRARRFRDLIASQLFNPPGLARTTVAVDGDEVVGFVQAGVEAGISLWIVAGTVRIFGWRTPGFVRRDRARSTVHLAPPPGAYHIAEIHVLSTRRNRGIGEALLDESEHQARSQGFGTMSLTTTTSNPARRLYERFGFDLVETRESEPYRAATGIAGRILMVKRLA